MPRVARKDALCKLRVAVAAIKLFVVAVVFFDESLGFGAGFFVGGHTGNAHPAFVQDPMQPCSGVVQPHSAFPQSAVGSWIWHVHGPWRGLGGNFQ